jgi:hypothetical protein
MFGSSILEVAVGLALIFLTMSLVATAVREGIEGVIKARAVNLERGIRSLLDDKDGTGLARIFYEHPLIFSLYQDSYAPSNRRFFGRKLPTYIPASSFSSVLIDLAWRGPAVGPYAMMQTASVPTVAELRANAHRIPSPYVQHAFLTAIDSAGGDLNRVRANLEAWFDSAMNSVSGWYRRRTQLYLFVIGLVLAVALNVNTLTMADHLWRNDRARAAVADMGAAVASDSVTERLAHDTTLNADEARRLYAQLQALSLPIGWDRRPPAPPATVGRGAAFSYWAKQAFGIALTAFAIMLGAPFWFDTLNKFVVIRSTVKPREKTAEEGSEDRQTKDTGQSKDRGSGATSAKGTASAAAPRPPADEAATDSAAMPVGERAPLHQDQQWGDAEKEDGVL